MVVENQFVPNKPTTSVQNEKPDLISTVENLLLCLHQPSSRTSFRKHQIKRVVVPLKFRFTRLGATLHDVLQLSASQPDSAQGVVFPDQFAYDVFRSLYDPFLAQRHLGFPLTHEHPPVNWGDWSDIPDLDPNRKFIRWASVSVSRNLDGFRFTPTVTPIDLGKLSRKIISALDKLPPEYSGKYTSFHHLSPEEKQQLEEDRFLFDCGKSNEGSESMPRFWPFGRGLFVSESRAFVIWVNAKDHLRIISQEKNGDLQNAYRLTAELMSELDQLLSAARHNFIGHVTVHPDEVGTGLSVLLEVRLPDIADKDIDNMANIYHMNISHLDGEVYQVSSKSYLGKTEFELVAQFCDGVRILLSMVSHEDSDGNGSTEYNIENSESYECFKEKVVEEPRVILSHNGIPYSESFGNHKRRWKNIKEGC